MKKIIFLILFSLIFIVGCDQPENPNNKDKEHIHLFETEISFNETYHFYKSTCGHDITNEQSEHQFNEEIIKEPTHFEKGEIKYTCSVCNFQKTEEISIIHHSYNEFYSFDEENHYFECECKDKANIEAHDYKEGEIMIEENELTDGLKKYTCKCGSVKEEIIDNIKLTIDTDKNIIYLVN